MSHDRQYFFGLENEMAVFSPVKCGLPHLLGSVSWDSVFFFYYFL